MKTITVITPSNIEVEYRLAGAGSRLAAFVIDLLLQLAACLLLAAIVLLGFSRLTLSTLDRAGGTGLAFLIIACFAIHVGYFIACELLMNGQSIGKRIFGLRVIRDNGQPVGLAQSIVRNLFRTALDMMYVGIFLIMASKKHKRFGDMAAGTVVVSEHYEPADRPALAVKPPQGIGVLSPRFEHIMLTESERHVLQEYLRRRETLPHHGAIIGRQIVAYFSKKWAVDANLFDEEILARIAEL